MTIRQTALIGFSPFETMTLESFFRLAGRRPPGYAIVADPALAHVLVVNADNETVVHQLWANSPKALVILIGANPHGTTWTIMPRPIRLLAVLDMIEKLLVGRHLASPAPHQPAVAQVDSAPQAAALTPVVPPAATFSQPLAPPAPALPRAAASPPSFRNTQASDDVVPAKAPAPASPFATVFTPLPRPPAPAPAEEAASMFKHSRASMLGFGNSVASAAVASPSEPGAASPADSDDLILVVDDSDIVLRFMQGRLQRFGYSVELASTGEQAVQMTQSRMYKFVFLDVMMPGIDGYQTCRMIKKQKHAGGSPVVVMLSSRGGSIDKIRGTLAGADSYLTKPLAEAALIKVLADHDTQTANNFSATRPVSGVR